MVFISLWLAWILRILGPHLFMECLSAWCQLPGRAGSQVSVVLPVCTHAASSKPCLVTAGGPSRAGESFFVMSDPAWLCVLCAGRPPAQSGVTPSLPPRDWQPMTASIIFSLTWPLFTPRFWPPHPRTRPTMSMSVVPLFVTTPRVKTTSTLILRTERESGSPGTLTMPAPQLSWSSNPIFWIVQRHFQHIPSAFGPYYGYL